MRSAAAADGGRVAPSVAHGKMNASPRVNRALPASSVRLERPSDSSDAGMFLVPTRPPVARTTVRDLLGACPDGEDEDAAERFITSAPRPGDAAAAIRAGGDMVDSTTIVLSRVTTT